MLTQAQMEVEKRRTRRTMFWRLYSLPWILLCILLSLCVIAAITYKHSPTPESAKVVLTSKSENEYLQALENCKNLTAEMEAMRAEAIRTGNGYWRVLPNGSNSFVYTPKEGIRNGKDDLHDLRQDITEVLAIQKDIFAQMYMQVSNGNRAVKLMTGAAQTIGNEGKNLTAVAQKLEQTTERLSGVAKDMELQLNNSKNTIRPKSIGEVENEKVFDGRDWLLAESVGYDLEKELDKGIGNLVSFEVARWDGKSKKDLETKLQIGSQKIISGAFQGFKTYHRINK